MRALDVVMDGHVWGEKEITVGNHYGTRGIVSECKVCGIEKVGDVGLVLGESEVASMTSTVNWRYIDYNHLRVVSGEGSSLRIESEGWPIKLLARIPPVCEGGIKPEKAETVYLSICVLCHREVYPDSDNPYQELQCRHIRLEASQMWHHYNDEPPFSPGICGSNAFFNVPVWIQPLRSKSPKKTRKSLFVKSETA